jgi:hypothetical protein
MSDVIFPVVGSLWRHYKGEDYVVLSFGYDTATGNPVIIYRSLNDETWWVRLLGEFLGYTENHERRFLSHEELPKSKTESSE